MLRFGMEFETEEWAAVALKADELGERIEPVCLTEVPQGVAVGEFAHLFNAGEHFLLQHLLSCPKLRFQQLAREWSSVLCPCLCGHCSSVLSDLFDLGGRAGEATGIHGTSSSAL